MRREQSGHVRRPWELRGHEALSASVGADDATFRAAWARGRLHSLPSAVDATHRLLTRPIAGDDAS